MRNICYVCKYRRNIEGTYDNNDSCCKYPGTCHGFKKNREEGDRTNKKIARYLGIILTNNNSNHWPRMYNSKSIVNCNGFSRIKIFRESKQSSNQLPIYLLMGILTTITAGLFFLL